MHAQHTALIQSTPSFTAHASEGERLEIRQNAAVKASSALLALLRVGLMVVGDVDQQAGGVHEAAGGAQVKVVTLHHQIEVVIM